MLSSILSSATRRAKVCSSTLSRGAAAMRLQSTSTTHDNDPETLDREKQRNLSGNQHKTSTPHKNAPGWNEYLASSSEAAIKADRSDAANPEDMQKETTEHIRARHHADEDDATNRGTQTGPEFQKEDVQGPLGRAKGDVAGRSNRSSGISGDKS